MADTTKQGIDNMADFLFSLADTQAISAMDSEFLNNKGDKLYREQNYGAALEYFRIACAMEYRDLLSLRARNGSEPFPGLFLL